MANLRIKGDVSGYVDLVAPDVAGSQTVNLDKLVETNSNGQIIVSTDTEHQLTVQSATSGAGGSLKVYSAGAYAYNVVQNNSREWRFGSLGGSNFTISDWSAGPAERLVIKSNGNVGIGTTDPQSTLHVNGHMILEGASGVSRTLGFTSANGATGWSIGNGIIDSTHNFRIYDNTAGQARVTVNGSGNVGIGTTDPSELLTINQGGVTGYIRMEGPSSGDYAGGLLMYRGSTLRGSIYTNPTHNMTILSETGINFRSNGAERFRIDHAQAQMVHVQGDTADHSGTGGGSKGFSLATAGGTSCPLYFGTETNSAQKSMYMNGYWIYLRGHQNEGIRFVFSQGGGTAIRSDQYQFKYNSAYRPTGNTTWDGFSDARAKENVTNLTGALDTISQLRPVTFDWTDDYADTMNMFEMDTTDEKSYNHFSVKENGYDLDRKTNQIGFIAQEFEEVFPKSITETEMQLGDTKVEDFKTVNYDHLIPVLTKAVQELKAENDALKARIEALEGQ